MSRPTAAAPQRWPTFWRTLFDAGGSMVDSSPMYGRAEAVVGKCLSTLEARDRAFVATKVWTRGRQAGIDAMRRSLALLGTPQLDLMQIHNLLDWRTHLATLRDWKAEGIIRYHGVTHYTASAHAELAAVLRSRVARLRSGQLLARGARSGQRTAAARRRPRRRRDREQAVRRREISSGACAGEHCPIGLRRLGAGHGRSCC